MNSEHSGPMGTEDQRNSGNKGIVGTEDQWNSGHRGPVGTEDQENSGVSRKGQGSVANICNKVIDSYSSRYKCLKARASCSGSCTFHSCSNSFEQRQSESANVECGAPQKRAKV